MLGGIMLLTLIGLLAPGERWRTHLDSHSGSV
jgi:hypothetical protein